MEGLSFFFFMVYFNINLMVVTFTLYISGLRMAKVMEALPLKKFPRLVIPVSFQKEAYAFQPIMLSHVVVRVVRDCLRQ